MARKRYQPELIAASGGYTTSRNINIAGLASAILLANDLRTKYTAHVADVTVGEVTGEHKALHTAGVLAATSVAAYNLTTLLALTNDLTAKYVLHNTDAIAVSPTYHQAQDTTHALVATTSVTTLAGAITRINDIKAKYDAHDAGAQHASEEDNAALGVAISVPSPGSKTGDLCLWNILNDGTGNVTGVSAVPGSGATVFTFSADPQDDCIISYAVFSRVV